MNPSLPPNFLWIAPGEQSLKLYSLRLLGERSVYLRAQAWTYFWLLYVSTSV